METRFSVRPPAHPGRYAALLLLATLACSPAPATSSGFLIGAVIDRSGSNSEPTWGNALALAEQHMNAAMAAAGHPDQQFHIAISDSRNDPSTATALAIDLVRNQGAKALILGSSQDAVAVNQLNYDSDPDNDVQVPLQCSSCTSGSINNPTATSADPVQQMALRNSQKWMFRRTVRSARRGPGRSAARSIQSVSSSGTFPQALSAAGSGAAFHPPSIRRHGGTAARRHGGAAARRAGPDPPVRPQNLSRSACVLATLVAHAPTRPRTGSGGVSAPCD
jgi:hypothetical protein